MNEAELLDILACGEDNRHQFKSNISNVDALASELVAFANSGGGLLIIGVGDSGAVQGLDKRQLLSSRATLDFKARLTGLVAN